MMKFFVFPYCVAIIFPAYDIVITEAAPFQDLGLSISPFFFYSPILLAIAIYCIMTYRLEKKTKDRMSYFKKNHILWRAVAVFLVVFILSASLNFYKQSTLGEVLLPERSALAQNENLIKLQAKLDFKITWETSSAYQGMKIYFAQAPGRKEKVEAALAGVPLGPS
jgi:hypothetical protein